LTNVRFASQTLTFLERQLFDPQATCGEPPLIIDRRPHATPAAILSASFDNGEHADF